MSADHVGARERSGIDPATARRLATLAGRRARLTTRHLSGRGQQWRRIGQWPAEGAPLSTLDHAALTGTSVALEWGYGAPERAEISANRDPMRPHRLTMPGRPPAYGDDPEALADIAERELRDELSLRSFAWNASHDHEFVAWAVAAHRDGRTTQAVDAIERRGRGEIA